MKIRLLTALMSLAAISCAGKSSGLVGIDGGTGGGTVIACSSEGQCGNNSSCFAKRCVDRIDNLGGWAVELSPPPVNPPPPPETAIPTITELLSVSGSPVVLRANSTVPLVVQFAADSTSTTAVPTTATVILTVPSRIPGRPDLSFQAAFTQRYISAELAVPPTVLGQQATVNLIPLSPADVTTPPYTFSAVQIPTSGQTVNAGMLSGASFKISGQLVDPLVGTKGNFTVRAFQDDVLASTTATTSPADGGFTIYLAAGSGPVNLQLLPAAGVFDPWMTLAQIPLSAAPKDLGQIALPAHPMVNAFHVTVHGNTPEQPAVGSAAVRAVTTTFAGGDTRATFKYLRDGSTDADGNAQLNLIPGDSQTARIYVLSVVPPAGSPWETQCMTTVPVLYNGSPTPTTIQNFLLPLRPVISGTLLSMDGVPIANAVVTATLGKGAASGCLSGAVTTSVITDATGAFKLALDPGQYQLDYDPPAGSPAPRLTESYEVKINGDAVRTIHLPSPALFEGDVEDAQEQPLPFTTIRVFEPNCPPAGSCGAPTLRGQTQSDAAGHFRAIVAAP